MTKTEQALYMDAFNATLARCGHTFHASCEARDAVIEFARFRAAHSFWGRVKALFAKSKE